MSGRFALGLVLLSLASSPGAAQFVTPIPRAQSASLAATGAVRRNIAQAVLDIVGACTKSAPASDTGPAGDTLKRKEAPSDVQARLVACRVSADNVKALRDLSHGFCQRRYEGRFLDASYVTGCEPDTTLIKQMLVEGTATPRARWSPVGQGRPGMVQLYGEAGDLRFLNKFAANMRDDQITVLADVVSGLVGIFPFAVSTAQVVQKNDTTVLVPGLATDLTRLIDNGGTLSGRFGAPFFATQGTNVRSAVSLYGQAGLLGDLSKTDSLTWSGAVVLEQMSGFAIRKPSYSADHVGDIILGTRVAYAGAGRSLGTELGGRKRFPFLQFAVGLTQPDGSMGISVLFTRAFDRDVNAHIRRLMVNLSAAR